MNTKRIRDRIRELRRVKASELLPNPKNWRVHPKAQADALRGLLNEIGMADALLARETADGKLMLIDGHLRAETTPKTEVPVLVLDVNQDEADKLLLTLDPLAGMAGKDDEKVKELLASVEFESKAVGELLERVAGEEGWNAIRPRDVEEDAIPAPPVNAVTRPGDIWLLGKHRLLCGDSTNPESVRSLMGDQRAVLFQTGPPYAVGYSGGAHPATKGNNGAKNKDKDWSDSYHEADDAELGCDFYLNFVQAAIDCAIELNAAWIAGTRADVRRCSKMSGTRRELSSISK
jgi:ParB-like chromosome segregation protein Spo0J